ncbi:hypothetical protein, partial [Acidiplasma sp.]|uniref:hypothetical protein n=1 Tax=Acidiplasma sp. TaxID=1872114 RepID=UPI00258E6652
YLPVFFGYMIKPDLHYCTSFLSNKKRPMTKVATKYTNIIRPASIMSGKGAGARLCCIDGQSRDSCA